MIRNARVVDFLRPDPAPEPVDLLIRDGIIEASGPSLEMPRRAHVEDAEGRWAIPGLWDQHTHLAQWTLTSQRLDLAPVRSPEEALDLVARRIREVPDQPIIGWGHRSAAWSREVTVTELDAVTGDTPTVLISGDGHHAWLNSVALMHLALPVRDSVVSEGEWFAAYSRLSTLVGDDGTSPAAYKLMLEHAASMGVVGLVDYEFSGGYREWAERWAQGCDLLRIRMASYADGLDDILAAGLRTGDPLPGCDDRAQMGSLKIISDGSLNTRTAWCCEPYADGQKLAHPRGQPNLSGADLRDLMRVARDHDLSVATHAIGDAACREALDAYAETGAYGTIEHAQFMQADDIRRMGALHIAASVQPGHLLDDRDLADKIWRGRTADCYAFGAMRDAGVELRLGSDAPVSPLDPWLAMAAAVHRSADERAAWHPEHALSPAEALAASVDGQPPLGVGSLADIALLDRDPLAPVAELIEDPDAAARATAAHLRSVAVNATYVAGRRVHA